MSVEQRIEAQHEARMSLLQCGLYLSERNNIIRRAHAAGITYAEIARLLGMNRNTVSNIASMKPGDPQSTPEPTGAAQQPEDDT